MSISLLEKLAGKTEEFDIEFGSVKVRFKTLSQKEYDEINLLNPRSDIFGLELDKVPTLARAMISIDGVKLEAMEEFEQQADNDLSDIRKKEEILKKMDSAVLDSLYSTYMAKRDEIVKKKIKKKKEKKSESLLIAD